MVAEDYDVGVGVEFLVGAGGDLSHGHQERVGQAGGLKLPEFADVKKERRVGLLALLGEGFGCDFRFEHSSKDSFSRNWEEGRCL